MVLPAKNVFSFSLRVFYRFRGVKAVANGRAASAPAEHPVIHRTIARKRKKRHFESMLFYRKKFQLLNQMI